MRNLFSGKMYLTKLNISSPDGAQYPGLPELPPGQGCHSPGHPGPGDPGGQPEGHLGPVLPAFAVQAAAEDASTATSRFESFSLNFNFF